MKSLSVVLVASALSSSVAQVIYDNKTNTFHCSKSNGNYCAYESLQGNIIIRCTTGVGYPGNCNDNLAGYPPLGVNYAPCYQTSPTSGNAACSKNGTIYPDNGIPIPMPSSAAAVKHSRSSQHVSTSSAQKSSSLVTKIMTKGSTKPTRATTTTSSVIYKGYTSTAVKTVTEQCNNGSSSKSVLNLPSARPTMTQTTVSMWSNTSCHTVPTTLVPVTSKQSMLAETVTASCNCSPVANDSQISKSSEHSMKPTAISSVFVQLSPTSRPSLVKNCTSSISLILQPPPITSSQSSAFEPSTFDETSFVTNVNSHIEKPAITSGFMLLTSLPMPSHITLSSPNASSLGEENSGSGNDYPSATYPAAGTSVELAHTTSSYSVQESKLIESYSPSSSSDGNLSPTKQYSGGSGSSAQNTGISPAPWSRHTQPASFPSSHPHNPAPASETASSSIVQSKSETVSTIHPDQSVPTSSGANSVQNVETVPSNIPPWNGIQITSPSSVYFEPSNTPAVAASYTTESEDTGTKSEPSSHATSSSEVNPTSPIAGATGDANNLQIGAHTNVWILGLAAAALIF